MSRYEAGTAEIPAPPPSPSNPPSSKCRYPFQITPPGTKRQGLDGSELSLMMLLSRLIVVKSPPCFTAMDWRLSPGRTRCLSTKPWGDRRDCVAQHRPGVSRLLYRLLEEKVNKGHAMKLPVGTAYLQAGPVPLLIACDDFADPPGSAEGRAADL